MRSVSTPKPPALSRGLQPCRSATLLALSLAACVPWLGSCRGCDAALTPGGDAVLNLLPSDSQTVISLDLAQIRRSPLWQALAQSSPAAVKDRDVLAQVKLRTGFDPIEDVHRIVVAFPEDARVSGQFAMVVYGTHMDEKRLVGYARDEGKLRHVAITQAEHAGQRMWVGDDAVTARAAFFIGEHTFVMGGGGWAQRMAEIMAAGGEGGLQSRAELRNLSRRLGSGHAAWAASVMSGRTRALLAADPRFEAASTIARLALTVDVAQGLAGLAVAEVSTSEHAKQLAIQLNRYILEARQSPKTLLLGVGPWLEGLVAQARGPQVEVKFHLSPSQTQSLAERLAGLVQLGRLRQALP